MCFEYFLSIPQKNLSSEKTVFTFQYLNDEIYSYTKKKPFATWQFGKIGVLVISNATAAYVILTRLLE